MAVILDRQGMEPAAKEWSVPSTPPVETPDVAILYSHHGLGEAAERTGDQEVEVVAQQAVGKHLQDASAYLPRHPGEEVPTVRVVVEDRPPGQAAVHHVVQGAGVVASVSSYHHPTDETSAQNEPTFWGGPIRSRATDADFRKQRA